jgi:hypothetical protein
MGMSGTWQLESRSRSQPKPVICPADLGAGSFRIINHLEVDYNRFRITKERSPSCEDSITVSTLTKLGRRGEKSKKNRHQQRGIDQGTVKWNLHSGNKRSILTLKARKSWTFNVGLSSVYCWSRTVVTLVFLMVFLCIVIMCFGLVTGSDHWLKVDQLTLTVRI